MTSRTDHEGSIELSVCCQPRVGWIREPVSQTDTKKRMEEKQRHVREAAGRGRREKETKNERKATFLLHFLRGFCDLRMEDGGRCACNEPAPPNALNNQYAERG